ncbi:MAG: NADH-quinone oxidoreductase subunit N [Anaerolineaceae bacterium]|nr:NADH-quinone oxidoreductase subunit N [Anaerolineaceae bacterium]
MPFQAPTLADLNLAYTWPVASLALGATILLLVDLFVPKDRKHITAWLAVAGLAVSFVLNLGAYNVVDEAYFGMFNIDPFSAFLNIVVLLAAFISVLISIDYVKRTGLERGEYYALILFTTSGIMLMGHANDLVVVFVALELLSIPLYILAALRYPDPKSEESGMKYLVLGAFASAFFVFGAALIYGATGTTGFPQIFASIENGIVSANGSETLLLIGTALVLVGLGFKVAAVPFHMWTPDVYEGAPTPVTAFMSVGAKVGGFAALLRIMIVALPTLAIGGSEVATWQTTVALLAAATLILGNVVAIVQTNIKRLLAYSSIAHAGYILMAVAAAGTTGMADQAAQSALIYMMAYMFTNLGAFAVALAIERDDGTGTEMDRFVGLSRSKPVLAAIMAVFMLSLTGIPLTAGFMGKWLVFQATLESGLTWLAIIGVLTSVVSAYYYVGIIVRMYLQDGEGDPAVGATPYVNWAVYLTFAGTIILGIFPALMLNLATPIAIALVP